MYPTDDAGRRQLADELTAKGYIPTQRKKSFDRDKINRMTERMTDGTFDWNDAGLHPVFIGPNSEVLGGHHRIIAAHLAGVDLAAVSASRPQVHRLPMCLRPKYQWIDVLPDVS
jgi:hypothetical protein